MGNKLTVEIHKFRMRRYQIGYNSCGEGKVTGHLMVLGTLDE